MRTCPACQHELDQAAVVQGKCPHCGAILRKLSQRTFEDKQVRDKTNDKESGDLDEFNLDELVEHELTDTDQGGQTIEISDIMLGDDEPPVDIDDITPLEEDKGLADLAGDIRARDEADEFILGDLPGPHASDSYEVGPTIEIEGRGHKHDDVEPKANGDDVTPLEESASEPDHKAATIDYTSDMTMEFQPPGGAAPDQPPSTRRSTHTLESDKTVDLAMSPAEAGLIDSQWRGTYDLGTKQSQTIRQRETIQGFRSSLPVKSRYVREKRTAPAGPPKSLAEVPDYELLNIIGEGGMGVVYAAHQSSIARTVAVKMLKPSAKVREEQRDKFISEAVVTGELDHPNIVPIYDLGSNDEGALFYSMKRVRGTPWDKVIHQKSLDENLGILLRVADAVAFAHAGGVIHRDLKPENVMLGDYGEVLVMDWGLARITPEFAHVDAVYQADSLGGTPAYMAPEMAKGPVEAINKTSDIYLLGAILYEIIGGEPPHSGRDVMQCLMSASQNRIDAIRYDGELKEIALKAMATKQEDRYQTVKEFQEAVRTYQSHSESLVLTAHANQNLQKARASKDYQVFARALYGFQESLTLWDQNHRAQNLLKETQRDYATCALEKGDLDLAASLLDPAKPEHEALVTRINEARAERDARQRRLRLARLAVAALLVIVVTVISIASVVFRVERNKAVEARKEAEKQRGIAQTNEKEAVKQKGIAVTNAQEAIKQKKIAETNAQEALRQKGLADKNAQEAIKQQGIAETNEQEAVKQRERAVSAKEAEEYEAYIAQIGLANAKINDNAYDYAHTLLDESKPELRNWEWGRLEHLCSLGKATYKTTAPVEAVTYSPDGHWFATGDMDGNVTVRDARTGEIRFQAPFGQYVLCIDYSPDGRRIAAGGSDKTIYILDATTGKAVGAPLVGHTDGVLSVRFSPNGRQLLSSSYDMTARLWDLASRTPLQVFKGHSWWVWAAEFSPDASRIVTAGQDGKAVVWEKWDAMRAQLTVLGKDPTTIDIMRQQQPDSPIYGQYTSFSGHNGAVYCAQFSPDGKFVVTGGYDKLAMIWNPDEVQPIDIGKRLKGEPEQKLKYTRLAGHGGPVRSVTFSPHGKLVLTGSEDNTIRIWDAATGKPLRELRGHSRAVRTCTFSPDAQWVLSGSDDESVRVWNVQGYEEKRVLHARVLSGHEDAVLCARFSHDGSRIVTASRDRTAALWDTATGKPLRRFEEGHEFLVSGAVFLPDERHLATGAGDNSVRVWDLTAGVQTSVLTPTGRVGQLAVSPDGDWIATGSPANDVQLWNAHNGALVGKLAGHVAEVSALAFSPTGDLLATGDNRGHLRLWKKQRQPANGATGWEF
ncbi:MAG TPA: protein kinase, partial [Lacipirellulaceae bacterium]|nr:protein kinase [Lacipirellulaceae bacterium]